MLPLCLDLFLPHEAIFAILCWSPVISLLRFKSVCKFWNSIIEDCKFINEHIHRSTGFWVHKTMSSTPLASPDEHRYITSCTGLILEKDNFTQNYRLRNPSTRKILDLPHPNTDVHGSIRMCFIPSRSDVKLVYPYSNAGNLYGCCKILTAGTDPTWRTLDLPFSCSVDSVNLQTILSGDVYYVMRLSNDLEMVCLEMENEELSRIKIPKSFFVDWTRVWPVEWEGKLSLACIEDDGVHLWALENWREQKWAENKNVVTWTLFSKDPRRGGMVPCFFEDEGRLIYIKHEVMAPLLMEALSGKGLDRGSQPSRHRFFYYFEPSLVHVKGMKRDTETSYNQTEVRAKFV